MLAARISARPAFAGAALRVKAPTRAAAVVRAAATARDAPWSPGSQAPAWLDGSLPGDFGYDPLGLGANPQNLATFRENEVIHGRWAMLGAAGMLAVELAGQGNWIDAQAWPLAGGSPTYLGNAAGVSDLGLNVIILLAAVGFVDKQRTGETGEKRLYPGGSFDPLGYANDKSKMAELQLKEIKNGRLAMIACMGFFSQGAVTHDGPIAALGKHLADPWGYNVATSNSIAIPPFHAADFAMGNNAFWEAAVPSFLL